MRLNERDKMKPCDCEKYDDIKKLRESGLRLSDYAIIIEPPLVIIEFCNVAELSIPMSIFNRLIAWYQENQNEKEKNNRI